MKTIKDSVHDHIEITGVARALLDTPVLQRLRRIRQLGTVALVYPSANHTRFEHSIGVYHLADRAVDRLGLDGQRAKRLRAAALLHDIGHAPFSHNIESLLYRYTGRYHDQVADLLAASAASEVLKDHDLDPERIAELIAGKGRYGAVISGELDVDRMDYLVRDAHHTGVPYGSIDQDRLLRGLSFRDGQLVLGPGNVQTAESLLIARALMSPTVYNHHVARIGKSMLRRASELLIETGAESATTVQRFDDPALRVALRECSATESYARRLDERALFKRAIWAEMAVVPESVVDASHEQIREWERAIAERADVPTTAVILDIPDRPTFTESTSRVVVSNEIRRLEEQSPLVEALRAARRAQWRLGVYAPESDTETVGEAAVAVLGLDTDGAVVDDETGPPTTLARFLSDGE